jgi:hypothetical protein
MREAGECDLADSDDKAYENVSVRREKRKVSRRLTGKMVTFLTSPRGRKRRFGAYREVSRREFAIVDVDGAVYPDEDVYDVRCVPIYPPSPDHRTMVYNCLLDETTEITITNPTLFDKLIRSGAESLPDDEFIMTNKKQDMD